MATVNLAAFLAIILTFRPYSVAAADFTTPFLSPVLGNTSSRPCGESVCGKGSCVLSSNSRIGYECECDSGWKQARADTDDTLSFLPCVIPNCTLNYNCVNMLPPAPDNPKNPSFSLLDPCSWTYCGGGWCNNTSIFTRSCECAEGYFNLFNSTSFPCYKECAFGFDCASLGIDVSNSTTSMPNTSPDSADESNSPFARLVPRVESSSLAAFGTILALVVWELG